MKKNTKIIKYNKIKFNFFFFRGRVKILLIIKLINLAFFLLIKNFNFKLNKKQLLDYFF